MVENRKKPKSNKRNSYILLAITSFFILLTSVMAFNPFNVRNYIMNKLVVNSAGDVPTHVKKIIDNEDGTYTLSLDVTGESEKKVNKANVIVVYDRSGSMDYAVSYSATTQTGSGLYGLVNGNYVELTYWNGNYYNGYSQYNGTRYIKHTRMEAATDSVKGLAESLLANNKFDDDDTNNDDIIEMALVSFSTKATTNVAKTNRISVFENALEGLEADGGTNWEAALANAGSVSFGDEDPTYVIFVSDGNPTFRNTFGNYGRLSDNNTYPNDNPYYNSDRVYGLGSDNPNATNYSAESMTRCYNESVDDAQALVNKKYEFYTIGIYGNADRMQSLTTAAGAPGKNYYAADDTEALQNALNEILQKIETAGIGEVVVDDGTTKSVVATSGETMQGGLLDVDKSTLKYWLSFPVTENNGTYTSKIDGEMTVVKSGDNYVITDKEGKTYTVNGSVEDDENRGKMFKFEWKSDVENPFYKEESDNPPAASIDDTTGEIVWDLSKLDVLSNQVTHTVTVEVWPSQVTLDIIADLKNEKIAYSDLEDDVQEFLVKDGDGYALYTNTEAKIDYVDTRVSDDDKSSKYDVIDPVPTSEAEMLAITKEWKNDLDERAKIPLQLIVNRDTESRYTVDLNEGNSWTDNVYISVGIMTVHDGKLAIKTTGHDYSFGEDVGISHNWEFKTSTVHPMMINNELTMLVKVDNSDLPAGISGDIATSGEDTYYKINGSYYVVRGAGVASLTATNERRSYLQFTKEVTGEKIPEDSKFTYTVSVDSADGKDVWFSIMNGDEFVTNTDTETYVTGATAEIKEGTEDELTGYYYAASGSDIEITIEAGWTVRFTNLPEGSTYSIEETEMPNGFEFTSVEGVREYTEINEDDEKVEKTESTGTVANKKISGTMSNANSKYLVTYSNKYLLTNVDVNKTWDDNNNQDGMRTTSVKVHLKADGTLVEGQEVVLSDANNWEGSFVGVPRYNGENEIVYTVEEEAIEGYTPEITGNQKDGYSIKNTHVPEKTDISVRKIWDDNNDQDGYRKDITVTFVVNGEATETTYNLTKDNGYTVEIKDLDKYIGGKLAEYSFTEDQVENYEEPVYSDAVNEGEFTITNKHTPETVDVEGTKTWDDNNNQDGMRPTTVTFNLMKKVGDSEAVEIDEVTLDVEDSMEYSFKGLPKRENGVEITYSITEDTIEGYTAQAGEGYDIVNKHTPEKTDISVRKIWDDNNDQDGYRKDITVTFVVNGEATETTYDLTKDNGYTVEIKDLDKYIGGKLAEYSFTEDQVENYEEPVYSDAVNEGEFTITNKHTPETVDVEGTKTWDDNNNQDGMRPEKVTFNLMKKVGEAEAVEIDEVTLDVEDSMEYSFKGLPKRENGVEITYSITEDTIEGYTAQAGKGYDIVNKHTPDTVDVEGTKTWDDNNDQDGKRPTKVTFNLMKKVGDSEAVEIDEVTLDVAESMHYSFKGLPKRENGVEITYSITEDTIEGYTAQAGEGYDIVNKHTPEKTDISVRKIWDDNNDQDGYRKDITVTFVVNGEATETTYNLTKDNGYTVEIKDLDKYIGGKLAKYSFTEEQVENYEEPVYSDAVNEGEFTITNKHTPETVDVEGTKTWDDNNNQDGMRPTTVTFNLMKKVGEAEAVEIDEVTLDVEDSMEYSFKGLPKRENGVEITYSIVEDEVANYEAVAGEGYDIVNKHTPETVDVEGTKTWDDNNNQDGMRPTKVTFNLMKKVGDSEAVEIDEVTLDVEDSMEYSFKGLPKRENGVEITYSIVEDEVANYEAVAGDGYDIVNKHTPETVDVEGTKTWDDNNNQDGKRPEKVTFNLMKKVGEAEAVEIDEVTLDVEDSMEYSFKGLPKRENGVEITYSVVEDTVSDYTAVAGEGYDIVNKHTPAEISIEITKTWDDNDDQDGKRPDSIEVVLLGDKKEVGTYTVTKENGWSLVVEHLPKYSNGSLITYEIKEKDVEDYSASYEGFTITNTHTIEKTSICVKKEWVDDDDRDGFRTDVQVELLENNNKTGKIFTLEKDKDYTVTIEGLDKYKEGELINYSFEEITEIEGYDEPEYSDPINSGTFTVTNTHKIETVDVEGTKTWDDNNNQDGKRPTTVTINLMKSVDGSEPVEVSEVTLTVDDEMKYSFKGLPKREKGKEITYSITEDPVEGYTPEYNGYSVVNKHVPETIDIPVQKIWNNDDNIYGFDTPGSINVVLYDNGEAIDNVDLTNNNQWTHTFTGLPKYRDGEEIPYTVDEVDSTELTDYSKNVGGSITEGFVITNTYVMTPTDVKITKNWDDSLDQDGERPASIMIKLVGEVNGSVVYESEEVELEGSNEVESWTYTFENLSLNYLGEEIQYHVEEKLEDDTYTQRVDSEVEITNIYTPQTVTYNVNKVWEDNNNQDGKRPKTIVVYLYDGEELLDTQTIGEENGWTYSFVDLPKYKEHGTLIDYIIKEETVEYYESEVIPDESDGSEKTVEIINTHIPEVRDITVSKEWDDNDNQDGKRPESVTIHLLANGEEVDSVVLSEDNDWTYTFEELDKYANGQEIEYTIEEDEVEDYIPYIDGFDVTNTHEIEKVDITIEKIWDDEDDKNGFRPESIEVRVLANDEEFEVITLSEDNDWKYTLSGLDKYANGEEIVYTIEEIGVENYISKINGFVITNTVINPPEITPPDTWISVEDDSNKADIYYSIIILLGFIVSIFTIKKVNE